MKCLTICQPWAWAIVHGNKRIENRSWTTPYRGPLLIHAGKSKSWLHTADKHELPGLPHENQLIFGAIIGICTLTDCTPLSKCASEPFAQGPWCWRLVGVQPLKTPIPYKGQQGLFDVPDNLLADSLHVTESK